MTFQTQRLLIVTIVGMEHQGRRPLRLRRIAFFSACVALTLGCSGQADESDRSARPESDTEPEVRTLPGGSRNGDTSDDSSLEAAGSLPLTPSQRVDTAVPGSGSTSGSAGEADSGGAAPLPNLDPPSPSGSGTPEDNRSVVAGGPQPGLPITGPPPVPTAPPIQGVTGRPQTPPTLPPTTSTTIADRAPMIGFSCEVAVYRFESPTYATYRIVVSGAPRDTVWAEINWGNTNSTYEIAVVNGLGTVEVISQQRTLPTAFVYSSASLNRDSLGCVS